MVAFKDRVRRVFRFWTRAQRYDVTREKVEGRNWRKNMRVVLIASTVTVAVLLVVMSLVYLILNYKSESVSDLDTLRQYRKQTESIVQKWIQEIYVLKNNTTTGYPTSNSFDVISRNGYIMQEIVKKMAVIKIVSLNDLKSDENHQNMFKEIARDLCQPEVVCGTDVRHSPYRTFDGSCNNLYNTQWGKTGTPQRRSLPADYSDHIGAPRMFGKSGSPLPSPRIVSNVIHSPSTNRRTDEQSTVMVMAFGQFMSHDIASTPMMDGHHSSVIKCCENYQNGKLNGPFQACFPVQVPRNDLFFNDSTCMSFTRSAPAVCDKCEICGREQINEMSSYIDASQVYGKSETLSRQLRTFSRGALLVNEENLLPKQKTQSCTLTKQKQYCFNAGDGRVNVVPNLSTLHTAFVRLHNRIAKRLSENYIYSDDEKLYQETRKILIAIMQNIVYNEYLPTILGEKYMKMYNLSVSHGFVNVYDRSVDASIANEFSTAAFRFGHVTIPGDQSSLNNQYDTECVSPIEQTYHNPNMTFSYCDGLSRWMVHNKGVPTDGTFDKGVRNLLFLKNKVSFDLAALNIQRGRDHGLPSYNHWRQFCGLPKITDEQFKTPGNAFGDFTSENADLFRSIYSHPDDIDLYSGGVKETNAPDAQVGPTFACLLAHQFKKLKYGDRFYYENPLKITGFTKDQLASIKSQSFAKVLCETMNILEIQSNVFKPVSDRNPLRKCYDLIDLNVNLWTR